ncbi:MAG: dihydropteroate synthase [Thermodesulfobacteriota bacterium]
MMIIANNITTRNATVSRALWRQKRGIWRPHHEPDKILADLAHHCTAAGADVIEINTQQRYDLPEVMEFAVNSVRKATNRRLCLSTNKAETLEAGLQACSSPPIVNYISLDEERLQKMLPVVASYEAEAVLLLSTAAAPSDADKMLQHAAVLIGAANEKGIPNEKLIVDVGLVHITSDIGQRHLAEAMKFLLALREAFDPPVRSTCWLNNASTGAPRRLRRHINSALLGMLAGAGVSSAFADVLDRETMRTVRLIRIFQNQVIYSDGEIER